jgi:hypothetical protein
VRNYVMRTKDENGAGGKSWAFLYSHGQGDSAVRNTKGVICCQGPVYPGPALILPSVALIHDL